MSEEAKTPVSERERTTVNDGGLSADEVALAYGEGKRAFMGVELLVVSVSEAPAM